MRTRCGRGRGTGRKEEPMAWVRRYVGLWASGQWTYDAWEAEVGTAVAVDDPELDNIS